MPPNQTILDMEWDVLMKSGQLRNEFNRMRVENVQLKADLATARDETARLRSQARFEQRQPAPVVQAPPPVQRPAPRTVSIQPVVVPEPVAPVEERKDLDEAVVRFGLLELDL